MIEFIWNDKSIPVSCLPTLQVIIKDNSLVLTPSHIKAYMLMTLQGLEYLHQHWILHRVRFLTKYDCVFML